MRRSLTAILWRVVLAISLVAGPTLPVAAVTHDGASNAVAAATATADAAMPCHGMPAPKPVRADAPCDDGCCPQPECDPGACRVAGPLIGALAPVLPSMRPSPPIAVAAAPVTPQRVPTPLLRPPIV